MAVKIHRDLQDITVNGSFSIEVGIEEILESISSEADTVGAATRVAMDAYRLLTAISDEMVRQFPIEKRNLIADFLGAQEKRFRAAEGGEK